MTTVSIDTALAEAQRWCSSRKDAAAPRTSLRTRQLFASQRLRWGQATALTWPDVEAAEGSGVLRIRRSQVRGVVRNTTKTGRKRVVPFPSELGTLLRDHRRQLVEAQHASLSVEPKLETLTSRERGDLTKSAARFRGVDPADRGAPLLHEVNVGRNAERRA